VSAADFALSLAQECQDLAHEAAQVEQGAPLIYAACTCMDGRHAEASIAEWVATRYAADSDALALVGIGRAAHLIRRTEAEASRADVEPNGLRQVAWATCMCIDGKHFDGDHYRFESTVEMALTEVRYHDEGTTHLITRVSTVTAVAA
jgi:hypothetical protein